MPSDAFLAALPKTDLHLHLVGSASVPTVLELARRHPDGRVPTDPAELRRFCEFTDFAHFLDVYDAVDELVQGPADITALVVGAARDAAASNARWIELTVTATTHLRAGIPGDALAAALEEGRELARTEHGVEMGWIIDMAGELGLDGADATLAYLRDHAPASTLAIGLAGTERGVPRARFARHVARARDLGLRAAIHAGEDDGPASVRSALDDLHADRIGHGIRAVDDPELLVRLAEQGTPLEVCVTSNLRTRVVPALAQHPLPRLLDAGVVVTVATDDPGLFDTDLGREYRLAAELTGRDEAGLADLARAGARASFAPDAVRARILAEIDEVVARA